MWPWIKKSKLMQVLAHTSIFQLSDDNDFQNEVGSFFALMYTQIDGWKLSSIRKQKQFRTLKLKTSGALPRAWFNIEHFVQSQVLARNFGGCQFILKDCMVGCVKNSLWSNFVFLLVFGEGENPVTTNARPHTHTADTYRSISHEHNQRENSICNELLFQSHRRRTLYRLNDHILSPNERVWPSVSVSRVSVHRE